MKFRTEFFPEKSSLTLDPAKPVVLLGSCFSQNIAKKMKEHLWEAVNPCSTLYNPFSIGMAIDLMCDVKNGKNRFEETLFEYNGLWNSRMFDSSFSAKDREDCISEFMKRSEIFRQSLREGNIMIVTFGTSICYFLSGKPDYPVGNCHKQPSNFFERRRISIDEIITLWNGIIRGLREKFPYLQIIFTVSPVRHLKDGFVGNSRSKAVLQLAIEGICQMNNDCHYFPAFEILNDDLRDYRFYASDLVHPSEDGIEYIWEIFQDTFLDRAGKNQLEQGAKQVKAVGHISRLGALGKRLS